MPGNPGARRVRAVSRHASRRRLAADGRRCENLTAILDDHFHATSSTRSPTAPTRRAVDALALLVRERLTGMAPLHRCKVVDLAPGTGRQDRRPAR
jgi:cobaltochelatase CobT